MPSILEIIDQNKRKLAESKTAIGQDTGTLLKSAVSIKLPVKAASNLPTPKINNPLNLPITDNASQSNSQSQLPITSQSITPETRDSDIGLIINKIEELRISLHEVHPNMPNLVHDIWKQLKDMPDCVTLIQPEHMGTILQGLERVTNIKLTESISKPKAAKKLKLTANDV